MSAEPNEQKNRRFSFGLRSFESENTDDFERPAPVSFAIEARSYSLGKMSVAICYAQVLLLVVTCILVLIALELQPMSRKDEWRFAGVCAGVVFGAGFIGFIKWGRAFYYPTPSTRMDDLFFRILRVALLCIPAYLALATGYGTSVKGVIIAIEVFFVLLHINYLIACLAARSKPPRLIVTGLAIGIALILIST